MQPSAIVTGASSGIGRATAIMLAQEGFSLVLSGRDETRLKETLQSVRKHGSGGEHTIVAGNIAEEPVCRNLVNAAARTTGRVDALCNIAGYARMLTLAQIEDRQWQRLMEVNLFAPARLIKYCWPMFVEQHGGCVVNVSSMAATDPFPGLGPYGVTKAALNLLTLVTAREGNHIGVRAVSIAPGAVETPMLRSAFDEEMIPRSAALEPEEVAHLIVDCIQRRRSFTSGEVIRIEPEIS